MTVSRGSGGLRITEVAKASPPTDIRSPPKPIKLAVIRTFPRATLRRGRKVTINPEVAWSVTSAPTNGALYYDPRSISASISEVKEAYSLQ